MWITNLLGAGLLAVAAATVVSVSPVQAADNYVFGRCQISRPDSGAEISPLIDGGSYLFDYHGDDPRYKPGLSSGQFFADAKVTLIKAPTHGKIVFEDGQWSGSADFHYWPEAGYVGKDRFVMQVEKNGVKVRIQYLIDGIEADDMDAGHCTIDAWKISLPITTLNLAFLQPLLNFAGIAPPR